MTWCSENVFNGWRLVQCSRRGVIDRGGNLYCRQHDPEAVKARRARKDAKYEIKWAADRKHWALEAAAPDLLHSLRWAMRHAENVFALTSHSESEWPELERARELLRRLETVP